MSRICVVIVCCFGRGDGGSLISIIGGKNEQNIFDNFNFCNRIDADIGIRTKLFDANRQFYANIF